MSSWLHVAAIVRVDSLRLPELCGLSEPSFEKIFGKERLWGHLRETHDDYEANPDGYLPCGSEGSLRMNVWTDPDESHVAAYTVSIFGDLRDRDDPLEIINWFKEKCFGGKMYIRQAVIEVAGYCGDVIVWSYGMSMECLSQSITAQGLAPSGNISSDENDPETFRALDQKF